MRYLGTKTHLLSQIKDLLKEKKILKKNLIFFDAFSGTGTVGEHFKDICNIIANDIQFYSFVLTFAKLNTPDFEFKKLGFNPLYYFNQDCHELEGFIYKNYSDIGSNRMYLSAENGKKIDFIRTKIEEWKINKQINEEEYYYLIACLIESVSKVANVAGVYGSYLKKWDPRAIKKMKFIKVEQQNISSISSAKVYNDDLEKIIEKIEGDILYLDPPYTNNQYSVQYHLLETIAKYDNPEIKGKGGLRNTKETSSSFSRKHEAEIVFEKIIANAKFKYIILSYNSDGLMSTKFIESVLKRYGKPDTFELRKIDYKHYRNHKAKEKQNHFEYLFYIEKKEINKVNFSSPLNYQGGKADLIDFIKENLPNKNIDTFYDLFGGGFNVGLNINAKKIVYNEINHKVLELIKCFRDTKTLEFIKYIYKMEKKYKLAKNDKNAYLRLRGTYNNEDILKRDPKMLYLLILYGFNQQIRFNTNLDYNNPVGEAGFNEKMLEKIISFMRRIQQINVEFVNKDFEFEITNFNKNNFIYCDPPYLITLGSYNDGKRGFNGWGEKDEKRLYNYLDNLNDSGIKFMLSNVLEHNNKINEILNNWIKEKKYRVVLNKNQSRKGRKEILVVNY